MDFFEKAKQTLSVAGKELGQKANELSVTAKYTVKIKEAERRLNEAYAVLGRQIMETDEETAQQIAPDMVIYIREKIHEIETLKTEKEELKNVEPIPVAEVVSVEEAVEDAEITVLSDENEETMADSEEIERVETDLVQSQTEAVATEELIVDELGEEIPLGEDELTVDDLFVEEMPMKVCPGCGNKIQKSDSFCIYCGMELADGE